MGRPIGDAWIPFRMKLLASIGGVGRELTKKLERRRGIVKNNLYSREYIYF